MDSELVKVEAGAGYQVWRMHFEPVNALRPEFLDAFEARLDAVLAEPEVSVVVLASGLRVFSAGADATWIGNVVREHGGSRLVEEFNAAMDRFRELCLRMRRSDVLFIAALNGHTLAGGLELAAACDLRFAADEDRIQIGVTEMKLFGVLPSGGGGTQFLSRILGPARALDFILEAEPYTPRRALELGLVQRVYPASDLLAETESFAGRIAARAGRIGVNAAKRGVLDAAELPLFDAMQLDHSVHWDAMRRGGFIPGVEAFVEKFGRTE
jgi:enoyl-CoA hydratase/carnithine racemase